MSLLFLLRCLAQPAPDPATTNYATLAAGVRYKDPSFLHRLILGANYRAAWATPVRLPLFDIHGLGFTIKELGGGQQTKSLHVTDSAGREWALRSVDKEVAKALPPWARHTLIQKITQDMVSAAFPYAPLVVSPLEEATSVVAAHPRFFIVPNDPALEPYTKLFQNTICLLEERNPSPDHSGTKNTEDVVKTLLKNSDVPLNQEAILRARLIDMLVGDWDRHEKQWQWGFEKVGGNAVGYAIPRDRDQALFYSKGLLVSVARIFGLKHLAGFAATTKKVKQVSAKAWNFDRFFLNGLDKEAWVRIVQIFTAKLTDSVIHEAVKKIPPEVYALNGLRIEQKLMQRRNSLLNDALRYYKFLASYVTISGTDAPERFEINSTEDSITVQEFTGINFSKLVYSRSFQRSETAHITILGLGGADAFVQTISGTPRIRCVIDGGTGANNYQVKRKRKTKFFNSALDGNAYLDVVKKELRIKDEP